MEKRSDVDLHVEAAEGGLKELVWRWFTETQAPLILHSGSFPDWFRGLAARKDAEDLLRDKAPGCFLIRLSDKAVGYILSYKGHDRCRHFVITQNREGRFVISGDCETHGSLTALIEHYKVSPIQPFGECLTSSCYEDDPGELYDMVNRNGTCGVSVQTLRTLWDHRHHPHSDAGGHQRTQRDDAPAAPPPALPAKSKTRKLMGTVSVDAMSPSQAAPPVPQRGVPLGFSLRGSSPDTPHRESATAERLGGSSALTSASSHPADTNYPGDLCPPGVTYSELTPVEGRSQSLPRLDNSNMAEEVEYSNQLGSPSFPPATPLKRVTCQTYSLHALREGLRPSRSTQQGNDVEMLRSNPLYQSSEGAGPAQQGDGMYAEVPQRPPPAALPINTYEQIPREAAAVQGNTYESLEDLKTKKSKSTWGKNNITWKKFLPDYKKK